MNHALLQNLLIILVIIVGLVATSNPLFVLALLLLQQLPFALAMPAAGFDDEDESRPMGFTQDVK